MLSMADSAVGLPPNIGAPAMRTLTAAGYTASIPKAKMSEAADLVVRIEHAYDDAGNPAFDDPLGAGDLGAVPRCAWFQRREEGRAGQRLVP